MELSYDKNCSDSSDSEVNIDVEYNCDLIQGADSQN